MPTSMTAARTKVRACADPSALPTTGRVMRRERGLGVIEVVIAVMVLMVVASGVVLAMAGGTKVRGAARVQLAMTSAGQESLENLSQDRDWMKRAACNVPDKKCGVKDVIGTTLKLPDVEGKATVVFAEATALDSEVDKRGRYDEDGVIPDYYRLVVELELDAPTAKRFSLSKTKGKRRFVTTIDRRGAEQVGSVAVEVCRVVNQADERMQLQGCRESGRTHLKMRGCPPTNPRPGCTQAWSWIAGMGENNATPAGPSPFVSLQRVSTASISFSLVNASTGKSMPSSSAKKVDGMFVFQNVPAGEYHLKGLPASVGARTERWRSKELPAYHAGTGKASIVVDPGIRNRALVMYRPTKAGSIRLYFDRKTRTYRLRGPFTAEQTSVPEMAPTDGYQGSSAAETCALINQIRTDSPSMAGASYSCADVVPDGKNCVRVLVSGSVWDQVGSGRGTHVLVHDFGGLVTAVAITAEMRENMEINYEYIKRWVYRATAVKYCTYYAEYFTHTYYGHVPAPAWETKAGAARGGVTYYSEPKPDARHIEDKGSGMYMEIPQCTTIDRGQCKAPATGAPALTSGLVPGLSSGLLVPSDDASKAKVVEHFRGRRNSVLGGRAIWTRTDGRMQTPGGWYTGATQTFTGMGECYWTSVRFSGKVEGPCDPCKPMWTRTRYYSGCAILTKTRWCRPAWETVQNFDWPVYGGPTMAPFRKDIEGHCGTINYSPPWRCTTLVPRTGRGSTCKPQPTGGGSDQNVPTTKHRSPTTNGNGIVNGLSMGNGSSV